MQELSVAGGHIQVRHFGNQPQASSEETPTAERPGESTLDKHSTLFDLTYFSVALLLIQNCSPKGNPTHCDQ